MIRALYLHVPFCAKRCAYCDFSTEACHDEALMDEYADALAMQLRRASRRGLLGAVETIYIGGGTPTWLGARRLNSLVYLISLSVNLEHVREFTLECNPDSLEAAMVRDLFALGVNRFSLGAQSFDERVLRTYGRIHSAGQICDAVSLVRQRTDNYSLDLICGGPRQSMASWEETLRRAIELGAPHVSVYPLALEEGTPLAAEVARGALPAPDDDMQADMMLRASELLEGAGLFRYEVASYARPGFESLHNTAYWTGVEYLGLGTAASSMLSPADFGTCMDAGLFDGGAEAVPGEGAVRVRVGSAYDTRGYCQSQGRPRVELEFLNARQARLEDLMLGMRRTAGVADAQVAAARSTPVFERLRAAGLVEHAGGAWRCTQRGWLLGNEVFGAIWNQP